MRNAYPVTWGLGIPQFTVEYRGSKHTLHSTTGKPEYRQEMCQRNQAIPGQTQARLPPWRVHCGLGPSGQLGQLQLALEALTRAYALCHNAFPASTSLVTSMGSAPWTVEFVP